MINEWMPAMVGRLRKYFNLNRLEQSRILNISKVE